MKYIATLLLAVPLLAAAQTYDLATDFSSTRNSAEPWQYGWSNGSGQTFVPYRGSGKNGTPLDYWFDGQYADPAPSVSHNPTSLPVAVGDHVLAPGAAAFEPGPGGEYSIYRWVAPQSGEYHLDVSFSGLGSRSTTEVYVLSTDGAQAFRGEIRGFGSTQTFSGNYTVRAGTGFDFVVNNFLDAYGGDTIGISAQLAMVPEPSSALMSGLGLALMFLWLRRRGRE